VKNISAPKSIAFSRRNRQPSQFSGSCRHAASADNSRNGYARGMDDVVAFESAGVRGFLHRPQSPGDAGLVLTHGAGNNCRSPLLMNFAAGFCAAGLCVLRCDLPFRQRRPRGPPSRSDAAGDREGLRRALLALRGHAPGPLFLGGHSYGGRQASLLAAEEPTLAAGLLLLSYPLHPPGRPERLRTEHFSRLRLKTVFVHGSRDPFGSVAELHDAVQAIPQPARVSVIDGAGHDLRRGDFDMTPAIAALTAA
jgi:uncharacterized protein